MGVHYRSSAAGAEATAERVAGGGGRGGAAPGRHRRVGAGRGDGRRRVRGARRVDVLVNNVGDVAREQMSWRDITEESIDHVLGVDIKGTMACIHEFGKRMIDQGHGSIVNIGSTVIVRGSARAPQYAAAKYGLLGATKSYAACLRPDRAGQHLRAGLHRDRGDAGPRGLASGRGDQLRSMTPMGRIPGPAESPARRCSSPPTTPATSPAPTWSPTAATTWSAPDPAMSPHPRDLPLTEARALIGGPSTRPSSSDCAAGSPSSARAAPSSRRPASTTADRGHDARPVQGVDLGHAADPQQRAPGPDDEPAGADLGRVRGGLAGGDVPRAPAGCRCCAGASWSPGSPRRGRR